MVAVTIPRFLIKIRVLEIIQGILVFEHNVGVHQLGGVYVSKLNLEVAKKLIEKFKKDLLEWT